MHRKSKFFFIAAYGICSDRVREPSSKVDALQKQYDDLAAQFKEIAPQNI